PEQPAAWVSGFYGSGKSHLARVLEYVWRDVEMPDGESARSLVTLPDEVRAHLAELSTVGKRLGGLWSAAGTLASGKSDAVRLATQFPPTTADISRVEMLEVMEKVLRLQTTTDGKLPLTLVVLDEMQQYIGDDNAKALDVQLLVEDCSARFQNQILILATGQ